MIPNLYQLTQNLRDGSSSAESLTELALTNQASLEPQQNAYKEPTPDLARLVAAVADGSLGCGADPGPLAGIPVSIKDLYAVTGYDTYAGSQKAMPDHLNQQGPLISNLRQQLGVITGKTHTVEFAFGGLGVNSHWGTPWNPWDAGTHRVSGGSSAGAGVSLIQGSALVALGSDTAGSVRIPASVTGTVGLKTSFGRWSLQGIFPLSPSLDTAGILCRSVEDAAFAFAALDPFVDEDPWSFIDHLRDYPAPVIGTGEPSLWETCDASISEAVETALKELAGAGAMVEDAPLPEARDAQELLRMGNVVAAQLSEFVRAEIPQWLDLLDPLVGSRIRDGDDISAGEYLGRVRRLRNISRQADTRFEAVDVIACPTVPVSPPALQDVTEVEQYRPANMAFLHHTCAANSLQLCSITLPVGLDANGMPVGLQLMAPYDHDEELLAAALWVESRLGDARQRLGKAPMGGEDA